MGYTYYNPLKVWLDPASIADVVSYMQKYLSENPIKDTEEINQIIADYIAAHPEIIGGVQSVNGETGDVVLTASDINTTGSTTIQAVLTSLSSQISDIAQTVEYLNSAATMISPNLFNPDNTVVGIINSSGNINDSSSYANYRTSEFIDLGNASFVSVLFTKPFGFAFYNSERTFIERLAGSSAPANTVYSTLRSGGQARYFRITYNSTSETIPLYSSAMVILGGDLDTPYSAYGSTIIKPPADTFDPLFMPKRTRQAAWRGCVYKKLGTNTYYTKYAMDNTWPAYHEAAAEGFDTLWCAGVRFSSDGIPYVHHDATLSTGEVLSECTSTFLDNYSIDVSSVPSESKALWNTQNLSVPRFEDVIKYCVLNKMIIGIRGDSISTPSEWLTIANLIRKYNIIKSCIFAATLNRCKIIRELFPDISVQIVGISVTTESAALELIESAKIFDGSVSVNIYLNDGITQNVMEAARKSGIVVFAIMQEVPTSAHLNNDIPIVASNCPDYIITKGFIDFNNAVGYTNT